MLSFTVLDFYKSSKFSLNIGKPVSNDKKSAKLSTEIQTPL